MSASTLLRPTDVRRMLSLRDLTDPSAGHHAMQDLVADIAKAMDPASEVRMRRANPIVPVADNYDRLGYEPDAAARDARYSRYVTSDLMLRAHTSAIVPLALEELAADPPNDVTLVCPGIVYRRDVIDRHHVGEPHQLDIWRVRTASGLTEADLDELISAVIGSALPGRRWRAVPATHPYTLAGRQIDVADGDAWVEVGECGLAHPDVLARSGLPKATGLASGWGLDRLLMLRKGIDDIRLLRSDDPRVTAQMNDLRPYQPVSSHPPAIRDVSLAMSERPDAELLGDRLRDALGTRATDVEAVEVISVTEAVDLPPQARQRLGMTDHQVNVLVRLTLRAIGRTLTAAEANRLRDIVYAELHEGSVHQWASGGPPA